jgi:hypothetical protein
LAEYAAKALALPIAPNKKENRHNWNYHQYIIGKSSFFRHLCPPFDEKILLVFSYHLHQ